MWDKNPIKPCISRVSGLGGMSAKRREPINLELIKFKEKELEEEKNIE